MDIEGTEIWRDVRQKILKTGPVKVLRRLAGAGHDLEDVFAAFVDDQTVAEVLDVLGEPLAPDADAHDAAVDALLRLAGGSRRLQGEQKQRVDELVLRVFDAWARAGGQPGGGPSWSGHQRSQFSDRQVGIRQRRSGLRPSHPGTPVWQGNRDRERRIRRLRPVRQHKGDGPGLARLGC